jgi:hypothetical protein
MSDSRDKAIARGERVVLGFTAAGGVLGGIPFLTGPLLLVSDYVLFIAVKRTMGSRFSHKDVLNVVLPTIKQTFAFSLFKAVADAYGWSWWATIPIGAVVGSATTYALGMCFVYMNADEKLMTPDQASASMENDAVRYIRERVASSSITTKAIEAIREMFRRGRSK